MLCLIPTHSFFNAFTMLIKKYHCRNTINSNIAYTKQNRITLSPSANRLFRMVFKYPRTPIAERDAINTAPVDKKNDFNISLTSRFVPLIPYTQEIIVTKHIATEYPSATPSAPNFKPIKNPAAIINEFIKPRLRYRCDMPRESRSHPIGLHNPPSSAAIDK